MNETIPLPTRFADRAAMLAHVAALSGRDDAASAVPNIAAGGRKAAEAVLAKVDPRAYAASRNHLDGAVTRLSPYIRHGVLSLDEVRNAALASVGDPKQAEKFIQELAWRDYWQRIYLAHPEAAYFNVGQIGRDQVADYAGRMGRAVGDVEKWLGARLNYDPDPLGATVA